MRFGKYYNVGTEKLKFLWHIFLFFARQRLYCFKLIFTEEKTMIAQLTGSVVKADLTEAVLDVHGVGYRVAIPMSTYDVLPREGGSVTLLTHLQISENDMALYGFATERERDIFKLLITVSGIGPKIALNILSSMNIPSFCQAVVAGDIKALKHINGIGPKSAERMVVELRDKIEKIAPESAFNQAKEAVKGAGAKEMEDAILALEQLGFQPAKIQKIVSEIVLALPEDQRNVENIVRKSLQALNK